MAVGGPGDGTARPPPLRSPGPRFGRPRRPQTAPAAQNAAHRDAPGAPRTRRRDRPAAAGARRRGPPKEWATVQVEGEQVVIKVSGWRMLWAVRARIEIPVANVISIVQDPGAYAHVQTRRLPSRSVNESTRRTFRVGAYHGYDGWSFWACGLGRNAVVIESTGVQFRFVVVEVVHPEHVVALVRRAADLPEPEPSASIRSIADAKRRRRLPKRRGATANTGPVAPDESAPRRLHTTQRSDSGRDTGPKVGPLPASPTVPSSPPSPPATPNPSIPDKKDDT